MESHSTLNPSAKAVNRFLYRLDLAYIGSQFFGWQSQLHGKTVQDELEKALRIVLRDSIRLTGASRTDTGVHAEHQVASFQSPYELDCHRIQRSLEALLPPSIGIYRLAPADPGFHPIYHACAKVYRYRFWQGSNPSPFAKPFLWSIPGRASLDINAMERASAYLKGRHNFRSFCASDSSVTSFERTIFDVKWLNHGNLLEFFILGDGFLKQMVRTLAGTLVEIGQGKRSSESLQEILESQDRTKAGATAPAEGLSLLRIFYTPVQSIPGQVLSQLGTLTFSLNPFET